MHTKTTAHKAETKDKMSHIAPLPRGQTERHTNAKVNSSRIGSLDKHTLKKPQINPTLFETTPKALQQRRGKEKETEESQ
jgi:hypothetical protein